MAQENTLVIGPQCNISNVGSSDIQCTTAASYGIQPINLNVWTYPATCAEQISPVIPLNNNVPVAPATLSANAPVNLIVPLVDMASSNLSVWYDVAIAAAHVHSVAAVVPASPNAATAALISSLAAAGVKVLVNIDGTASRGLSAIQSDLDAAFSASPYLFSGVYVMTAPGDVTDANVGAIYGPLYSSIQSFASSTPLIVVLEAIGLASGVSSNSLSSAVADIFIVFSGSPSDLSSYSPPSFYSFSSITVIFYTCSPVFF